MGFSSNSVSIILYENCKICKCRALSTEYFQIQARYSLQKLYQIELVNSY